MRQEWKFTKPDCWEELPVGKRPIHWKYKDLVEEDLKNAGYHHADTYDSTTYAGSWTLWQQHEEVTKLPRYMLCIGGMSFTPVLVWIPTFPELLAYMRQYGQVDVGATLQRLVEMVGKVRTAIDEMPEPTCDFVPYQEQ